MFESVLKFIQVNMQDATVQELYICGWEFCYSLIVFILVEYLDGVLSWPEKFACYSIQIFVVFQVCAEGKFLQMENHAEFPALRAPRNI